MPSMALGGSPLKHCCSLQAGSCQPETVSGVPLNARRQGALKKQQPARKPLEVGSSGLVWFSASDNVTDGPLSLPVVQPK